MPAMAPLALASIISSGAAAAGTVASAMKSKPASPAAAPQPEKAPAVDLFRRRNQTAGSIYGATDTSGLAAGGGAVASTKLGQ